MSFSNCFGDVGNGDWAVGRIYIDIKSINLATGGLESRNVTRRWVAHGERRADRLRGSLFRQEARLWVGG